MGTVVIPTYTVNGNKDISAGINQTVDLGDYTVNEIINKSTKAVTVPLIIDCSSGIKLTAISLLPIVLDSYHPISLVQPGAISTNLKDVAVLLKWKLDGSLLDFSDIDKTFNNDGSNIFDASIVAKIVPYSSSSTVDGGKMKSGIKVK